MRINWINVLTGGAMVVFVGVASLMVAAATAWAVSGFIKLPSLFAVVLFAVALVAALAATVAFARMAHSAEPFFERTRRATPSDNELRRDA